MVPLLVVHDFNVADQIADDFYTIEICSRDLRGGEVIFDSRYLFTRYEVTNCHDAPPNSLECVGMRPGNPSRSVRAVSKNLTVLQ